MQTHPPPDPQGSPTPSLTPGPTCGDRVPGPDRRWATVLAVGAPLLCYALLRELGGEAVGAGIWLVTALLLALGAGVVASKCQLPREAPSDIRGQEIDKLKGALQEARANYQKIFDNALEGFYQTTPEGRYLNANPALAKIYGYDSPQELMETRLDIATQVYVDPTRRAEFISVMEKEGSLVDFQSEVYRKDGTITWIEESARAVRDGQGRIICFEGSTQDISPRKRAISLLMQTKEALEIRVTQRTEELRASEARLHTVVSNAPLILWALDENGIFTLMDGSGLKAMGLVPGQFVGQPIRAFKSKAPKVVEDSQRALDGNFITSSCQINDRIFDTWFTPIFNPQEQVEGVIGTAIDVTDSRGIQERLHLLESVVVNANDSIVITEGQLIDPPGPRIIYANDAFFRATGYGMEEVLGQSPRFLQGPETDRKTLEMVRSALQYGISVRVELVNYRKNGTPYWVDMGLVPVTNEDGWCTHWISVQRDITLQKSVEEELRRAGEEAEAARQSAERANLAKSEFLSRISHELRTPLNAILGFTQLLDLDERLPQEKRNIEYILKAGQHLLQLVNEVLDITRIETGELSFSIETVEVGEVVREVMDLMEPLAHKRSILFHESVGPAKLYVLADRQRVRQVLLNLMSNAVKYNREGGNIWITSALIPLETRKLQGETAGASQPDSEQKPALGIQLLVRDDGPGIPPEKMERLFVPFDRLGAETTQVEGTGIGLALTRHLIEAMGGDIAVRSEVGVGATFSFCLPKAPTPEAGSGLEGDLAAAKNGNWDTPMGSPQRTVLYIEDNLVNLNLVESILEQRPNYRLLAAMQGGIGLELAREHVPDLILLDLHLPDIEGDEVLKLLKDDPATCQIPVVVLSADASPGQIERLRAAGANTYLTKPLQVKQFLFTLEALLEDA